MLWLRSKFLVLFVLVFSINHINSQEILPKGFSENEKKELLVKGFQFKTSAANVAPSGSVRTAAEWEEVEYLVVSWDTGFEDIISQIVQAGILECKVLIAYDPGDTTENSIKSKLGTYGISFPNSNITFISENTDSIWIRDFAGNTVYSDDVGQLGLVDWRYNRNRNNDDQIPSAHADELGISSNFYETNLVNTGGNFMSDGLGNAFASELVISENNVTPLSHYGFYPEVTRNETQIDAIMQQYMGISSYYKMPVLPYDGIHHIDMHMKLLDEETILVSKYPDGVSDGPQIEANINQLLLDKNSVFGTPYKIKWIDAPPSSGGAYPGAPFGNGYYRTFSNALIVNKTIMIPTYRLAVDAPAIAKYQELMPGYNIVGIDVDNSGENLISLSGAIHCITHTIGVADPLWMVQQPIDQVNSGTTITIDAMLKHVSGISSAKVFWREQGTSTFNEVAMSFVSGDDWSADLPVAASNTNIDYYIQAEATSGKTLTRPLVAPQGFWTTESHVLSNQQWAENNISSPYPNPAHDKVSFNLNKIGEDVKVSIYNTLGQQLFNKTLNSGNGIIELYLNSEWQGVLYIMFNGSFGDVTKKIIKY